MRLNELSAGEQGRILFVEGSGALRRRLMDMGLTPGTGVFVRKVAPLGDPIVLHLRGYELTLRKEDAASITVAKLPLEELPNAFNACHGRRRRGFRGGRV